ncbi:MAG TPA: MFS transporter [Pseudonocardia sp.]|jgi:MFS family permease|nr:MFS transporter [Pseudonocardia sp.]
MSADPSAANVTASLPRFGVRDTRRATVLAFLAWTFAVYDYILFGTLLPEMSKTFGWSNATASLVSTLVSVGTAIVVLVVGPIVDRIGRRRGMILTVAGTAVSSAASAATPGIGFLVGVRALSGLGLSEQAINATYLNEVYAVTEDEKIKRRRGLIYSLVQGGWPVGVLIASGFVAIFLPIVGWRGCFLLAFVPAVIIALLCRKLKESPQFELELKLRAMRKEGRAAEADALGASYGLVKQESAGLVAIFQGSALRNTLVLGLCWLVNWFGIQVFSVLGTTVLTEGKGVSFTNSLLMLVVINAVGYLGYVFHGWAGDRFGRRNVIAVGWVLSGVLFGLMLAVAQGSVAVVLLYSFGMFFLIGPYAALLFYMGECYETRCRATGTAFLSALSQPGAIVAGVIVTSMLASGQTWNTAALVVGALGILVSGLLMFTARTAETLKG